MSNAPSQARRPGRSVIAIVVGLLVGVVLSLGTDQILHVLGVYPPWGEPMFDPALNAFALGYRVVFSILASYVAARLAPRGPMWHAMLLGAINFFVSAVGAAVAISNFELGPAWYPIALAASALPAAWVGGVLYRGRGTPVVRARVA